MSSSHCISWQHTADWLAADEVSRHACKFNYPFVSTLDNSQESDSRRPAKLGFEPRQRRDIHPSPSSREPLQHKMYAETIECLNKELSRIIVKVSNEM
jgi:hypothetical protein